SRAGDGRRGPARDGQTRPALQRRDRPGPLVHQPGGPGARRYPRGKVPRAREIAVDGPWAAGRQGGLRIFVRGSPCCIPAVAPVVPTALTAPAPTAPTAPAPTALTAPGPHLTVPPLPRPPQIAYNPLHTCLTTDSRFPQECAPWQVRARCVGR